MGVKKLEKETFLMNNIEATIPEKPHRTDVGKKPPVKKKPAIRSKSVDLTQVGDSEWKDFVLKRKQEKERYDPDEKERFSTVRSLNEHRNSIYDQTITEDQVLNLSKLNKTRSSNTGHIHGNVMPMTQNDAEFEKSATSEPVELDKKGEVLVNKVADFNETCCSSDGQNDVETENNSAASPNQVSDVPPPITLPKPKQMGTEIKCDLKTENDSTALPNRVSDVPPPITLPKPKQIGTELKRDLKTENDSNALPNQVSDVPPPRTIPKPRQIGTKLKHDLNTENDSNELPNQVSDVPPPITLPKPRQIGTELKEFYRSRAMSLPAVTSLPHTSFLRRSSDMLKDRTDSQTPYFCRNSRPIDIQDTLTDISNLSVKKETTDNGASSIEPRDKCD